MTLKTFLPERKFNDAGGCVHSQRAGAPFQAWEEAIIRVNAASQSAMLSQEIARLLGPMCGNRFIKPHGVGMGVGGGGN